MEEAVHLVAAVAVALDASQVSSLVLAVVVVMDSFILFPIKVC
jgi:hypothetical protein